MNVLFDSEDILAIEKPAGYLSVPSSLGRKDPRPVAGLIAQETYGTLFPVHRLDFEVSGILIFAKNPRSQKKLHQIWDEDLVEKNYLALTLTQNFDHWPAKIEGSVVGEIAIASQGQWVCKIAQGKRRSFIAAYGKPSVTDFELQKQNKDQLLWSLKPQTGRRHQLRLELSRHGFPILGDTLYGGLIFPENRNEIALVHHRIQFHKKANLQLPDHIELGWNWTQWMQKFNP